MKRVLVIIGAMLVIVVALMISHTSDLAQVSPPPLIHSQYDERLDAIDREAIEEAYRTQIMHLFQTWMKDDTNQPQRALVGARRARRVYIDTMTSIKDRKHSP
jgi:hypothetical protein